MDVHAQFLSGQLPMARVSDYTSTTVWTAMDLVQRFGDIPLHRVVQDPAPGTATVDDVVRLDDHHDRLCELIDGTLVEKTMGVFESFLASQLIAVLANHVNKHNLGIVAGEAGMMQILPNQVRIPDVSFLSWNDLKDSGFPDQPAPNMAPTLAVEIISKSNTAKEMERKLGEYFTAGTRLVWYVYPDRKEVEAYTSATEKTTLGTQDKLTGGDVLPGFELSLESFFTLPTPGSESQN